MAPRGDYKSRFRPLHLTSWLRPPHLVTTLVATFRLPFFSLPLPRAPNFCTHTMQEISYITWKSAGLFCDYALSVQDCDPDAAESECQGDEGGLPGACVQAEGPPSATLQAFVTPTPATAVQPNGQGQSSHGRRRQRNAAYQSKRSEHRMSDHLTAKLNAQSSVHVSDATMLCLTKTKTQGQPKQSRQVLTMGNGWVLASFPSRY